MNTTHDARPRYLDGSLPFADRAADLLGRMTLPEKISQMLYNAPAIDRLGIPQYNWWNECLHGVARAGRATVFPQAIGLAATWDVDLVRKVADAISTEGRAKHHESVRQGLRAQYRGLTFWTPNINIFRDGRWGRGQETYGEDPVLTAAIGTAFVRGLQGDHPKYLKAAACAKHYAVHSGPEADRHGFDARVSRKDLFETYLPAFEALVKAGVESVMGAYNRTNGEACCASPTLLGDILRGHWGFQGHVVSDCWAVMDIHTGHKITKTMAESAALAVKAGCDLCCGECYGQLGAAVQEGLVSEADIDRGVQRVLMTRFKLGMFDDPKDVPFASIPASVVGCDAHRKLARKAAVKSIVLLKNNGILPLKPEVRELVLTGPNAFEMDVLLGNYYGLSDRMVTVLEGIAARIGEDRTMEFRRSTHLTHKPVTGGKPPIWLAKRSQAVIAVMGISPAMEGEENDAIDSPLNGDRENLELPPHQIEFLRQLKQESGKPLIVVLAGGSLLAIPDIHDIADAILMMWYPGEQGGHAVADVLFGDAAPSGKLPVTFPRATTDLPPYADYAMRERTYRYATAEPLYPFGFGLSYTTFRYDALRLSKKKVAAGGSIRATVTLTNTGARDGDEIVQLYLTDEQASCATPRWALKAFRRVAIKAGKTTKVTFEITPEMMQLIDDAGQAVLEKGFFTVSVGGNCPHPRGIELGAPPPATARFELV